MNRELEIIAAVMDRIAAPKLHPCPRCGHPSVTDPKFQCDDCENGARDFYDTRGER